MVPVYAAARPAVRSEVRCRVRPGGEPGGASLGKRRPEGAASVRCGGNGRPALWEAGAAVPMGARTSGEPARYPVSWTRMARPDILFWIPWQLSAELLGMCGIYRTRTEFEDSMEGLGMGSSRIYASICHFKMK